MKKQKQNGSSTPAALFGLAFVVFFVGSWCVNLYKLIQCDFESDYKCEVVHAVGVFLAPASVVTVWIDDDSEK